MSAEDEGALAQAVRDGTPDPDWDSLGPKAKALVRALNQYDDWYGSVLEVIAEAKQQARQEIHQEIRDAFHMDVPKAPEYRVDPEYIEQIEAMDDQLETVLDIVLPGADGIYA